MARVEEKHALLGLHANFANREKTQFNGCSTGDGLREMVEGK